MKICSKCGAQVGDNNAFCVKCGAPIGVDNQEVNNSEPQQEAPQQNMNYQNNMGTQGNVYQQNNFQQAPQYMVKPNYDHTDEFDKKDVSENKVMGMCAYLDVTFGIVGVIIALLGSGTSKYAAFHARQALKIVITQILFTICLTLVFLIIGLPIMLVSYRSIAIVTAIFVFLYAVGFIVLFVARIVSFFQVCKGKALEPIIMRHFGFMR